MRSTKKWMTGEAGVGFRGEVRVRVRVSGQWEGLGVCACAGGRAGNQRTSRSGEG